MGIPYLTMMKSLPKIYVASRATSSRIEMWKKLRNDGANIVSSWIDSNGDNDPSKYPELWERIKNEIKSCDRLVIYFEPDDFPLKGALVEVGMALSLDKPVLVINNGVEIEPNNFRPVGSWLAHPLVRISTDLRNAVDLK